MRSKRCYRWVTIGDLDSEAKEQARTKICSSLALACSFALPSKTSKFLAARSIIIFLISTIFLTAIYSPAQTLDDAADALLANPNHTARSEINEVETKTDSLTVQHSASTTTAFKLTIPEDYQRKPLHPYFRDEYRVVKDLRRLVRFAANRGITGFESVEDLVEIGQNLPLEKQTAIVSSAMMGSAANILAGITNKQLRKRKIKFIRWDVDRVTLRTRYRRMFSLLLYKGAFADGVSLYFPKVRINYALYATSFYALHGFTYWVNRKFGASYRFGSGQEIYSGIISPYRRFRVILSYRKNYQQISTSVELRNTKFVILRFIFSNILIRKQSSAFRSEMLVRL